MSWSWKYFTNFPLQPSSISPKSRIYLYHFMVHFKIFIYLMYISHIYLLPLFLFHPELQAEKVFRASLASKSQARSQGYKRTNMLPLSLSSLY